MNSQKLNKYKTYITDMTIACPLQQNPHSATISRVKERELHTIVEIRKR